MNIKNEIMKEREFKSWFEILMCVFLSSLTFGLLLVVALITYR